MTRAVSILLVAVTLACAGTIAATPAGAAEAPRDYIVLAGERADRPGAASAIRQRGGTVRRSYRAALNGHLARMSPRAAARLRTDPRIEAVVADTPVTIGERPPAATGTPVSQTGAVWGLDRIDQRTRPLDEVYRYTTDGSGVRAYIVDTGVRSGHAEFTGRTAPGMTAIADGGGTADCHGHGTHVAGTVAGRQYGVAKGATIVPVRVLDCAGSGTVSGVVAGLDWIAMNHPAGTPGVANLSLGGGPNLALDSAVRNLTAAGVTVVAAAGNDSADACLTSPARVGEAITVGASTSTDLRSSFSNTGTCVDLFAPGSAIRSAHHTGDTATALMSGTSMAAPHAAGAVARLLSRSPAASPEQVHEAIVSQATPGVLTDIRTGSPNLLLHADPLAGALYTTFATRPAALIGADRATFAFAANVPATYACRLDEAPWAACASPHTVTGLADGTHTLRVRATDADGATEVVPAQVTFTVDTIAPTTVISGASVREDGALAVTFAADEQADHACRIDDAPFADCTSPWLVTGLPVGDHRVEVRATDAVGNIEDPPARRVIRVEAPPVAPAPGPAPGPLTPAPPVRRPAPAEPAPAAPAPRVGPIGVSPLTLARGRMPVRALAVTFRLTAPARVRVVVHRRISGRRIAGRCVSPALAARSTARARPCVRYVRVGALSRAGAKGVNRVALRPPARGPRALSPGRYRVTVVARAAGAPPVARHADTIIRAAGLR